MAEYKVQFEIFEGPLDLLLYLVRKEEVDIYQVNLTRIATEFIEYVELMRKLDLEVAGEFVVMAATLMYIKSRELLPRDKQVETGEDEDEEMEDPRWELIRQLVEYKKFKDAAARLQEREQLQERSYPRRPTKLEFPVEVADLGQQADIFALLGAVNQVLKRFENQDQPREIFEDRWSVSDKIEVIRNCLASGSRLRFSELFSHAVSRTEVVVTFLAMLELIRLKQMVVVQPNVFGDIEIHPASSQDARRIIEEGIPEDARVEAEPPAADSNPATGTHNTGLTESQTHTVSGTGEVKE